MHIHWPSCAHWQIFCSDLKLNWLRRLSQWNTLRCSLKFYIFWPMKIFSQRQCILLNQGSYFMAILWTHFNHFTVIHVWSQMRWILFSVKSEVNENKMNIFSQGFRQIGSEFCKNPINPWFCFFSWKMCGSSFTLSSNMALKGFIRLTLYFRSSLSMIFMLLWKQV